MIRVFRYNEIDRSEIFSRDISSTKHVEATVAEIIAEVRARKDAALFEYCAKFDKANLDSLQVSEEEIDAAEAAKAAEAAEKSPEEYRKEREERQRTENAERMARRIAFEEKMRKDLSEVHAAYPDTREYDSVMKLPNFERFAQYRDLGLPPKKAYAAANPDGIRAGAANAARRQALPETKKHMRSAVPKSSKDTSVTMTKQELHSWKEMLPNLTDKEIISLYKKTAPKKS